MSYVGESLRGLSLGKHDFFPQDSIQVEKASAFIQLLEKHLSLQEGSRSPLQVLLKDAAQLSGEDANTPVIAAMTGALFKQEGYFARLFSKETWEDWTENRTSLGKIVALFMDCVASQTQPSFFVEKLGKQEIQQANKEAEALLKKIRFSLSTTPANMASSNPFYLQTQSICAASVISGLAASSITRNPLSLLIGCCGCLSQTFAQQKIGSEFQVNTYTTKDQKNPSIASFSNGNFVVTWDSDDLDGLDKGVFGQLFASNRSKIGNEFQVNTYTNNFQDYPAVSSLSNGNFVVTWESSTGDGSGYGVFGQLFTGNGSKIRSEFQVNTFITNSQRLPSVASFSNGNFVATWQSFGQDSQNSQGIFGQLFDGNGSKIGNEFQVNSNKNKDQSYPSVTSLNNGYFVVTWTTYAQDTPTSYGIFGQIFNDNGSKIGNEFQVNTYKNNNQYSHSVSSLRDGNFVVTWGGEGQEDTYGIFGQLFDGIGSKLGNEFQVNTYTNHSQTGPSIASFNNGNFVVTWTSDGQDGSWYGVFGQLFDVKDRINSIANDHEKYRG